MKKLGTIRYVLIYDDRNYSAMTGTKISVQNTFE